MRWIKNIASELQIKPCDHPGCDTYVKLKYAYCYKHYQQTREIEDETHWEAGDKKAKRFYIYILEMGDGTYYVGQTNHLRARLENHRKREKTAWRRKLPPKLVFFDTRKTREEAAEMELQLKRIRDKSPRTISSMVIEFKDLISELDYVNVISK